MKESWGDLVNKKKQKLKKEPAYNKAIAMLMTVYLNLHLQKNVGASLTPYFWCKSNYIKVMQIHIHDSKKDKAIGRNHDSNENA